MSTFGVVICVLILLALWVVVFFRRRSDRRRRARQMAWEEMVRHYPDLDRELDQFWDRW